MIGQHIAVARSVEQALCNLRCEAVLAVGGSVSGIGTELKRSDVVPKFGRHIYVNRVAVVLVSAHHSHLLSCGHAPVVVEFIVKIHPVGAVKPVTSLFLLIDALTP